ncbi:hypothetical protein E5353_15970 [Bacteroides caecimuris]|uniref:Uncharacterized protein n=1 Tax=Bacteroides caecimuris TaxID=1796613 RepID=A0A4S2CHZ4_9BACE|nr:hypothetical protein E5353_15970 [Bacteroides caecimuris]
MVIAKVDEGKEKLLAVGWKYHYSVVVQVVDRAKYARDKTGYLGEFSFFERYSLLVLVNEAFGKNVFFLMILSVIVTIQREQRIRRISPSV